MRRRLVGLTCRRVRDKATDRAGRKASRERWPALTSATASRPEAKATAAAVGPEFRPADSESEQVVHGGPKIAQARAGPATTPVEITFKPQPVYTDEARGLKLEGEVLLEVMFGANGTLHVNRVVRGLGHGLDEAAIAAANKMRFKPAHAYGTAGGFNGDRARDVSDGVLRVCDGRQALGRKIGFAVVNVQGELSNRMTNINVS